MNKTIADRLYFQSPSRRMKLKLLKNFIDIRPEDELLEIGCGYGAIIHFFSRMCKKAVGIDYSKDLIDVARSSYERNNLEFHQLKGEDAVTLNRRFDKVFMFDVFEHIDESEKILKACFQLLKEEGSLYVLTQRSGSRWRGVENWLYGSDKCGHYHDGFDPEYFSQLQNFKIARCKHIYPFFTPLFTKINNYMGYKLYGTLEAETMATDLAKLHNDFRGKLISYTAWTEYLFCNLDCLLPLKGDSFIIELKKCVDQSPNRSLSPKCF